VTIGDATRLVLLPNADSASCATWARSLGKAARLSQSALHAALRRVLSHVTSAITGPISELLPPGHSVTWLSTGAPSVLPVDAAAASDGRVMGERHCVVHAPTGLVASQARMRASASTLNGMWMSVGSPAPSTYPPLPGAHLEMTSFGGATHAFRGNTATVDQASTAITTATLAHFACHARTTAADPLMNSLILAGDEPLFADDIARLASVNRLTVLSACDTAAPGTTHADEGLGLPGALLAAGSAGIVASLWSVGDDATARLMATLAEHLHAGQEPRDALQSARLGSRDSGDASAWAAFHLIGT
jgi:CHAT domain-containing protein